MMLANASMEWDTKTGDPEGVAISVLNALVAPVPRQHELQALHLSALFCGV